MRLPKCRPWDSVDSFPDRISALKCAGDQRGRGAGAVERGGLENRCPLCGGPRVRIPPSPLQALANAQIPSRKATHSRELMSLSVRACRLRFPYIAPFMVGIVVVTKQAKGERWRDCIN